MGINPQHLLDLVITPGLTILNSVSDCNGYKFSTKPNKLLLLGTAYIESNCGEYLQQNTRNSNYGTALGIYQIEPATYKWVTEKLSKQNFPISLSFDWEEKKSLLITNLEFASHICRFIYWYKTAKPLPDDPIEIAHYYKKYYNSALGATTIKKAEEAFIKMNLEVKY